ncbi:alpha/beta fold hydrolase [Amycolatopsis sacchari]|uniref:alpha/beta fold hydrolase n=1 Tax=Amycolatopsis sacchari TaxID=115433 RepID=UPI000B82D257|nr:alpha/beta fold hydrolase [Amycolatopsis sacchari]
MSTVDYVLVHGAWHGGWCWERVAAPLRERGHRVHTPTLSTGDPGIGLRTHVDEVAALLAGLDDVVLVGHSYSGFVVREAADRMPERVRRIVLVDAWYGRDGDSMDSRAPEWFVEWVDSLTADGMIATPPASTVGVREPADVAWLEENLRPQPRRTFSEPTRLTGAVEDVPCHAVLCVPNKRLPFAKWAAEFGWPSTELRTGHDAMVTAPGQLAEILLAQA